MRVQILNETSHDHPEGWRLCFQWGRYLYDVGEEGDKDMEYGYRFIWRKPNGNLQPGRAQARIPSIQILEELIAAAKNEGWGDYDAEKM